MVVFDHIFFLPIFLFCLRQAGSKGMALGLWQVCGFAYFIFALCFCPLFAFLCPAG